jgi:hypothetical protein
VPQKKRDHKVSRGERIGARPVRLAEQERPASVRGGIVAKFKPIGEFKHLPPKENG